LSAPHCEQVFEVGTADPPTLQSQSAAIMYAIGKPTEADSLRLGVVMF
jgi:hypothetical protein